jgi:hypothetical protein
MISLPRTLLNTMESSMTYEAMTCTEQQVSIVGRESGQNIEGVAVDSN